jgi:hypothetical protein
MTPSQAIQQNRKDFVVHVRGGTGIRGESPFEKTVILPAHDQKDVAMHAWADARFTVDIMAEHALFFVLLMPPEVAARERAEAEQFHQTFTALYVKIDAGGPPQRSALRSFASAVLEEIKPFIDYKARLGEAQATGKLRSLVWPLFFDHTQHEAERWTRRLQVLASGQSEFDHTEVATFWTEIMDEHARFVAHLVDPNEFELIDTCMKTSGVFRHLHHGGLGGVVGALVSEPSTVVKSLVKNPETIAILSAAETILDFKTKSARDIEAGRIKSIIDPRLADHVRREALKFVDELKRAV